LTAAFLGAVIIWVVGFSHVEAIHNAATRYAPLERVPLPLRAGGDDFPAARRGCRPGRIAGRCAGDGRPSGSNRAAHSRAETFEEAATSPPSQAGAPGDTGHTHDSEHAAGWQPHDGFRRIAATALADVATGIGFALLLVSLSELSGLR
jgi:hypothetical protein